MSHHLFNIVFICCKKINIKNGLQITPATRGGVERKHVPLQYYEPGILIFLNEREYLLDYVIFQYAGKQDLKCVHN